MLVGVSKLKPAKPATGCSSEGEGERVSVGEVVADVVVDAHASVVLVRGDWEWEVGSSDGRVVEKTVRSFWRELEGERRRDGMVVFLRGVVLRVVCLVCGSRWVGW